MGNKLKEEIKETRRPDQTNIDVEDVWIYVKNVLTEVQESTLKNTNYTEKQEWTTTDILELLGETRKWKRNQETKYKLLDKIIRKKCRAAKEEWMSDKCKEIELLQDQYNSFIVPKK